MNNNDFLYCKIIDLIKPEVQKLRPILRWVYAAILGHRNTQTGKCNPGMKRIALITGICENYCRKLIKEIEDNGVLIRVFKTGGTNQYIFTSSYDEGTNEIPSPCDTLPNSLVDPSPSLTHDPPDDVGSELQRTTKNININSSKNIASRQKVKSKQTDIGFEIFWKSYPRKVEKVGAYKLWQTKLSSGIKSEIIIEGVKRYAIAIKDKEMQFIKHPTTWLKQHCWEDDINAIAGNGRKNNENTGRVYKKFDPKEYEPLSPEEQKKSQESSKEMKKKVFKMVDQIAEKTNMENTLNE